MQTAWLGNLSGVQRLETAVLSPDFRFHFHHIYSFIKTETLAIFTFLDYALSSIYIGGTFL